MSIPQQGSDLFFLSRNSPTFPRKTSIFTVRNSGCGKVMFSQACVKNSVQGEVYSPTPPPPPPPRRPLQWTVCILLECILVLPFSSARQKPYIAQVYDRWILQSALIMGERLLSLPRQSVDKIQLNSVANYRTNSDDLNFLSVVEKDRDLWSTYLT